MSLLSPRIEAGDFGDRRLVFRLFGRVRVAPGGLALFLVGHASLSVALAAPLLAWGMPLSEPYRGLGDLALDYLSGLPMLAWLIAAALLVPVCVAIVAVRIWTTPEPHDWAWSQNAPARIALASMIVLPVASVAFSVAAVLGLAANPKLFPVGAAPMPRGCAWLHPAGLLATLGLPALWAVVHRREMRAFEEACEEAGPACAGCGYSLVGLTTGGVCPECGAAGLPRELAG